MFCVFMRFTGQTVEWVHKKCMGTFPVSRLTNTLTTSCSPHFALYKTTAVISSHGSKHKRQFGIICI